MPTTRGFAELAVSRTSWQGKRDKRLTSAGYFGRDADGRRVWKTLPVAQTAVRHTARRAA
jgi:hypothetical protein